MVSWDWAIAFNEMKKHFLVMQWVVPLISLIGCNKESAPDCFKKAGPDKTEVRMISAFQRIELRDYIQYELVDSTVQMIEIEAPANLISKIRSDVTDGTLLIENRTTCNFVRSFKHRVRVRIYSPEFTDIQNYATGDVRSVNTLNASYFKIDNRNAAGTIDVRVNVDSASVFTHTGVCDVVLMVTANQVKLFAQGVGFIDASGLQSNFAFVNNSSINDVHVKTLGYLYAFIQYSGNILVYGSPQSIDSDLEGTGDLILIP